MFERTSPAPNDAFSRVPSEQSVTRAPIARPIKVSFILPMICNASEGLGEQRNAAGGETLPVSFRFLRLFRIE
jgi:hypothetical protein